MHLHDEYLLRKFKINKQVQIKLCKLELPIQPIITTESVKTQNLDITIGTNLQNGEKDTQFRCDLCEYSSKFKHSLMRHMKRHPAKKQFKCLECAYASSEKSNLTRHVKALHNKNPGGRKRDHECRLCADAFFTRSHLERHITIRHTKEKLFRCQFCNKAISDNTHKHSHEKSCAQNPQMSDEAYVERLKMFKCQLCNVKVTTKFSLKTHMRIHSGMKPFKCRQCNYATKTSSDLAQHSRAHHNPSRKRTLACKLCPKTFFEKADLRRHISTHTQEKPFKCIYCNKQFSASYYTNQHTIICKLNPNKNIQGWMEQQKKFKCNMCEYFSALRSGLTSHLKWHEGIKSFKCPLCSYACFENNTLINLRIHTGEKPFNCPQCAYSTGNNGELSRHIKRRH